MSDQFCDHRIKVGGWCAACDMYDQPATASSTTPQSDLDRLAALAEAATAVTLGQKLTFGAVLWEPDYVKFLQACTPATVTALIERIREMEADGCSCICSYCDCIEGRADTRERVEQLLAERDRLRDGITALADEVAADRCSGELDAGYEIGEAFRALLNPPTTDTDNNE